MYSEKRIKDFLKLKSHEEEGFFLTAYLPLTKRAKGFSVKEAMEKRMRSLVQKKLRSEPEISSLSRIRDKIIRKIEDEMQALQSVGQGLVLFAFLNPVREKEPPEKELPDKEMKIMPLARAPRKEATLGKELDLDQLIWIENRSGNALIININREKAELYLQQEGGVKLLEKIENKFRKKGTKTKKEALKTVKLGGKSKAFYGVGADKIQKTQEKQSRLFLNNLAKEIKTKKELKEKFTYILVFYSKPYEEIIEGFLKKSGLKSQSTPLLKDSFIKKREELEKRAQEIVNSCEKKKTEELIEKFKQKPGKYKEGWEKVVEAARLGKIDTLFVKPRLSKKGAMDKNGLPTLEREEENIEAYLVRFVIENGGTIRILSEEAETEVAAGLRF